MRGAEAVGRTCRGSGLTNVGQPQLTLLFALMVSAEQAGLQKNSMKNSFCNSFLSYKIIISIAWS